ncbi:MAG TPA: bifunctional phosphoribosylaminoimidazolecarboxamide formyltransferase/IMP cyclohydrolase [bacterium]|uniref:Bifunctional purine biosynthesis protein PurH n=1 Tax=candidate division TA06 bacterium ADurb.Bin417 TaxID=1852828 RepID=A0A1V5MER0_UNCT6|nr:MAG: Bifunctional purine biosynthesis protein PurH [candidate division TA06 bacterium ADurb.Bin417]HNQ34864.1 bifunctional phosphoribosylaminoimidazolecarboxamide formyltransferase/IMP cyclohydrolase [bacterium]HNS48932.1 bifunctional phosphoribosylaminoimidazolecarboxamide formyltransferase/IMP cyclohydrolase [bacterium]
MITIRRALLSVSDKAGIVDLARALAEHGTELVSTGGTAKALREVGLAVTEVSELTGFPEMLDGRVKTLHPKIFASLLHRRDLPDHLKQVAEAGIQPIDLVAVNLYPFEKVVGLGCKPETAIENIDIGGPSLLRAAAKNGRDVVVLSDPGQYPQAIADLKANRGRISRGLAQQLAAAVFARTAAYDAIIHRYLSRESEPAAGFPPVLLFRLDKVGELRYGENPHQPAALYREEDFRDAPGRLVDAEKIQGKELSFNNYLDLEAAYRLVREFDQEAAVIVKHNNPCGVALGTDIAVAFRRARACDPVSAFGGIVALNRPVTEEAAREITTGFVECVIAPEYAPAALKQFQKKPAIRVLRLNWGRPAAGGLDLRPVGGGFLAQEPDASLYSELKVAGRREPTAAQLEDLKFAYTVAKHVKSNAIVLVRDGQTIGIGAGQMSRVDSARIAVSKAREFGFEIKEAAVASDAFFPFPDALEVTAEAGATSVIHPGGSKKDAEVLAAAEKHGMVMIMAGQRHFRH